jgi:phosphatidylserine decarboxylase
LSKKLYYIDRSDGEKKEERIYCKNFLLFLYNTRIGKSLARSIAQFPPFSRLVGWKERRKRSRKKIPQFIVQFGINPEEFQPSETFRSFDDFFTRKLKPGCRPLHSGVILPADGRYLAYQNVSSCALFGVKDKKFNFKTLLNSADLATRYEEGAMVLARLAPCDYHRFHFPIDCLPGQPQLINGLLHSVNPMAVKKNINLLTENKRMVTPLVTDQYGTILFIEIGATCVGSIHQTFIPGHPVKKGEEKGYFSFGGSSIILLFEKGKISLAPDLLRNSADCIETRCLLGQPLETNLNQ